MRMEESVGLEKNFVDVELPVDLSLEVADNRILKVCLGLKKSRKEQVVLVTKDILLRIKAQVLDLCAEDFISEQVIAHDDSIPEDVKFMHRMNCLMDLRKREYRWMKFIN